MNDNIVRLGDYKTQNNQNWQTRGAIVTKLKFGHSHIVKCSLYPIFSKLINMIQIENVSSLVASRHTSCTQLSGRRCSTTLTSPSYNSPEHIQKYIDFHRLLKILLF